MEVYKPNKAKNGGRKHWEISSFFSEMFYFSVRVSFQRGKSTSKQYVGFGFTKDGCRVNSDIPCNLEIR